MGLKGKMQNMGRRDFRNELTMVGHGEETGEGGSNREYGRG